MGKKIKGGDDFPYTGYQEAQQIKMTKENMVIHCQI